MRSMHSALQQASASSLHTLLILTLVVQITLLWA